MGRFCTYITSSIGQKKLMALTGIGWALFALSHMSGNFLLFVSAEAYNKYGHALVSNPAIYLAEAILVGLLLTHVIYAIRLTLKNKSARSVNYSKSKTNNKEATLASRFMIWQGTIVLLFIIYHLITFKFGPYYEISYEGIVMRDLFTLVVEVFQNPAYVIWYVISVILLGYHLSHGVWSSLQSLGFNHPSYTPKVKLISVVYGIVVSAGFAAQPIFCFFFY